MLDKTYRPEEVEAKQYAQWEESGAFAAGGQRSNADPYTIVIPPPNVTGSLHMGHALDYTLQDILIRRERMRGRDALWQPGTDHAGIATQMVVERELEAAGTSRKEVGRAAFLDKVWDWKAQYGGIITQQLRRLGSSCDWSRERFTMDEGLSRAVTKVFVELYKQGLIYKDKRLVNWDPKLQTAISDLEVQQTEVDGHLWYFNYPIEGIENKYITVATTRPETMLGDTAVAVHPDDDRYRDLVGKHVALPLANRRIPIVADEYADPAQGSGAVKITPAHDFNDFEVGRRHELEMVNIFDESARLNENAPEAYRGLDRFEARKRVVADLEALGLVDRVEQQTHSIPYGDRGGVPIEPFLTDQWYADAATLAKPAIAAVEEGRTRFVPEHWTKTYFEWMRNIQPWCISRQLWWGHQIPAWYGPDGSVFVEESEEAAAESAAAHYGERVTLTRDDDVLDTWFSSGLWPFSTLGWPDETPEIERHYPTDVLVTGFDIIFFWIARMMMMGLHFMGEVPFHTVYIHALIRDARGQKMSKSKGNVIDPLELIDEYGCDALRFTLASLAAPGRDIKLSGERVAGGRNFATKLWNAARFCQLNGCVPQSEFDPASAKETVNRWIIGELVGCADQLTQALDAYRFNEAANALYQFTWGTFCDWYLEFAKPLLAGDDERVKAETRSTAAFVLDHTLKLLHPIMPFISEELWEQLCVDGAARETPLIIAEWPQLDAALIDRAAEAEMRWVVGLIQGIRSVRSEMNVPPAAKMPLLLLGASAENQERLAAHRDLIMRLARLDSIGTGAAGAVPPGSVQLVHDEAIAALPLTGLVDITQEKSRLVREVARAEDEINKLEKKLANKDFIAKAPAEVVEDQREYLNEAQAQRAKLGEALERLAGV